MYILPDFRDKEANIVYELRRSTQDDQPEIIFYILMELQSTVDFHMPYCLLLYQVETWRDYMKNIKTKAAARTSACRPLSPSSFTTEKRPGRRRKPFAKCSKENAFLAMSCSINYEVWSHLTSMARWPIFSDSWQQQ